MSNNNNFQQQQQNNPWAQQQFQAQNYNDQGTNTLWNQQQQQQQPQQEDYSKYFAGSFPQQGNQNNSNINPQQQIDNTQLLQQQQMQYQHQYQQQQQNNFSNNNSKKMQQDQQQQFIAQPQTYNNNNNNNKKQQLTFQQQQFYQQQQNQQTPQYYHNQQVYDPYQQNYYNQYDEQQQQIWGQYNQQQQQQQYQPQNQQDLYFQQQQQYFQYQQQQQYLKQQQYLMQQQQLLQQQQLQQQQQQNQNIDKQTTQQLTQALQGLGFDIDDAVDESDEETYENDSDKEENQNQNYKEINQSVMFRTQQGVFYQKFNAQYPEDDAAIDKRNKFTYYMKNGYQILIGDSDYIAIYSIRKKKIIKRVKRQNIQLMHLSNDEKFIVIVEMKDKNNYSCFLLDPVKLKEVKEIKLENYARFRWPMVQFDEKDSFVFIKNDGNIEIQDTDSFLPITRLAIPQHENQLYISPKKDNLQFLLCQPETSDDNGPIKAQLKLYDFFKSFEKPEFEIELEHAQEIKPIWSPDGEKLLIWIQTMHDKTNQSYYGQHKLYIYDKNKKSLSQKTEDEDKNSEKEKEQKENEEENQDKQVDSNEKLSEKNSKEEEEQEPECLRLIYLYKGPIHDIQWNYDSTHFVVSSGYMPAGTVLFNKEGYPEFEFGRHHKNFVRWAKKRFLLIAGFGNLNGDIEIWDTIKFQKVGTCRAHTAVSCVWSPCGRKFMIGVLNPRLRQGNKMQVFKYDGTVLNKVDYSNSELYEVTWRPEKYAYKDRSPSPKKEDENSDKPKKLLFQPRGGGSFQAQLRAAKEEKFTEPRKLQPDEKFNSQEPDSPKHQPKSRKESDNIQNNDQKKKRKESNNLMIKRADPNKPKPIIQQQEEEEEEDEQNKQNGKKRNNGNNKRKERGPNNNNNNNNNDRRKPNSNNNNNNNNNYQSKQDDGYNSGKDQQQSNKSGLRQNPKNSNNSNGNNRNNNTNTNNSRDNNNSNNNNNQRYKKKHSPKNNNPEKKKGGLRDQNQQYQQAEL